MRPKEDLANSKDVADYLGVTENRLAKMRMDGDGPEFIKMGHRTIRYEWPSVRAWVSDSVYTSTDEYAVSA